MQQHVQPIAVFTMQKSSNVQIEKITRKPSCR